MPARRRPSTKPIDARIRIEPNAITPALNARQCSNIGDPNSLATLRIQLYPGQNIEATSWIPKYTTGTSMPAARSPNEMLALMLLDIGLLCQTQWDPDRPDCMTIGRRLRVRAALQRRHTRPPRSGIEARSQAMAMPQSPLATVVPVCSTTPVNPPPNEPGKAGRVAAFRVSTFQYKTSASAPIVRW